MSDQIEITGQTENRQVPSRAETAVHTPDLPQEEKKRTLKGMLMMAVCCAAPLLLVGAVALFGISLGALASGLVSVAALLACPVGMYLMMRMMNKKGEQR
jgi:hypothetical protein